ncbi:HlyD family efflux transporter periplasmic adaptor subunit [Ponticoccus alexandrii]|uniref:HlyD family efflux transporter periplasmic adaptor subunit n=1 Tax=Ponticoccus alexandrii TaxID=1943633 RepID=A0ABX7FHL5_9RHOB|nr:HlyD family efflux transporter periplasmic adaptor subunit [Ponticoccus alexandrii]ETA49585.1 secretion protein HlyD [Rhodobacteraceae bacterium PD-2]QRF69129.1 HlyD family efflux transporter periplasmic adaptor subunit [Ponticoccus alexandrii]
MTDLSFIEERPTARAERQLVWLVFVMLALFLGWAWYFPLVEVSRGQGTVVPSSREQVIQSLEGGIVTAISVREGDMVEKGQTIARLDATRSASNVEEAAAKYHAAIAAAARLRAELDGRETVNFPVELSGDDFDQLRRNELALFRSRRNSLQEALSGLTEGLELTRQELDIAETLQRNGAASRVEVIRLRREAAQTELEIARLQADARVQAGEELQRVNAEAEVQASVMRGRSDQLARLVFQAPMRGIVKDIAVTTIGGVVPPGGNLMTIVPMDDQLLIEARISPRDIAFIHPGQEAQVKLSAYDYAIFGGLSGEVVTISPNTVRDEVNPDQVYYRAYIRTQEDFLINEIGTRFPIVPGMIATVDIRTGEKTVWQYLVKPFNRAQEALRER